MPIRGILSKQRNATVRLAEAEAIDLDGKAVVLSDGGRVPYDTLVVAAGAGPSYLGHPEWQRHAPALKTIGDALDIRRRVLEAFEEAEWADDPAVRSALLTFVVVGAGPTGVELAGALAEIAFHTLRRDFRRFDPTQAKVILVEGTDAVLPPYPDALQQSAQRQLESLGVEVCLGARVEEVDGEGVTIGGERIPARTVLWAAGVQGAEVGGSLDVPLTRTGQSGRGSPGTMVRRRTAPSPGAWHPDTLLRHCAVSVVVSLENQETPRRFDAYLDDHHGAGAAGYGLRAHR